VASDFESGVSFSAGGDGPSEGVDWLGEEAAEVGVLAETAGRSVLISALTSRISSCIFTMPTLVSTSPNAASAFPLIT